MSEKISYPGKHIARFLANNRFTGEIIQKTIHEEEESWKRKDLESRPIDYLMTLALSRANTIQKSLSFNQEKEGMVKLLWKRFKKIMPYF